MKTATLTLSAETTAQGTLDLSERVKRAYRDFVTSFPVGTRLRFTLEKDRRKHSDVQRAYWWAVVVKLGAETTGYSENEFHELAKALHLDRQAASDGKNGRILGEYVIGGSITKCNTLEMAELITRTREWMAGALDCRTPDPDPAWREREDAA